MPLPLRGIALLAILLAVSFPSLAKVLRIEITSRRDVLDGQRFGDAGAYERIVGKVFFSVAIADPRNRLIVDLDKASNAQGGQVTFSADFLAVRPKDPHKGNGTLILEIPNRGHGYVLSLVDAGDWDLSQSAGNAWLLRNGYTIATLGWQWDVSAPNALRLYAPIAKDHGQTITGLVRGDLMPAKLMDEIPLGHLITGSIGGTEYPVAAPDDPRDTLTVRDSRDAPRHLIPRAQWQFAHTVNGKLTPSDRFLHLAGGFEQGHIYEYVYVAADPVVAGLGFAAVRDFASYVKHDATAIAPAARVIGQGISQDGRFLRDLLYQGFNADEEGRMALDGVLAHVAGAGRGSFNYRFAQPSRDAQPTSSVFFPTDIFPFTDEPETDPGTGITRGLLDRAHATQTAPKIFFSNTSYEYWGRAASLIHTTPDGARDMPVSPEVRIYHLTGLQHFSGPFPPAKGTGDLVGQEPESPLPVKFFWRAMIANMHAWLANNIDPPPSSYPKIADSTLVPLDRYAFPKIPGVHPPHEANQAYHLDFGPNWREGILTREPPQVGAAFPVLVPQVDADGNETDGVRLPEVTVPLATYTGWNLRDPSIGAPAERVAFEGSYLPFPKTAAERQAAQDPRTSIAERYPSREDYLQRFGKAADDLIQQRWVLPEDREALIHRGELEWDNATNALIAQDPINSIPIGTRAYGGQIHYPNGTVVSLALLSVSAYFPRIVTGCPYSALATFDSTPAPDNSQAPEPPQSARLFRDSKGRTRAEVNLEPPPVAGFNALPAFIEIVDPVAGFRYLIDPQQITARQTAWAPPGLDSDHPFTCAPIVPSTPAQPAETKTIEGIPAQRILQSYFYPRSKTDPRPYAVNIESWLSPELKLFLLSKNSDQRFGDGSMQLSQISRGEPDPALFQLPPTAAIIIDPALQ